MKKEKLAKLSPEERERVNAINRASYHRVMEDPIKRAAYNKKHRKWARAHPQYEARRQRNYYQAQKTLLKAYQDKYGPL